MNVLCSIIIWFESYFKGPNFIVSDEEFFFSIQNFVRFHRSVHLVCLVWFSNVVPRFIYVAFVYDVQVMSCSKYRATLLVIHNSIFPLFLSKIKSHQLTALKCKQKGGCLLVLLIAEVLLFLPWTGCEPSIYFFVGWDCDEDGITPVITELMKFCWFEFMLRSFEYFLDLGCRF